MNHIEQLTNDIIKEEWRQFDLVNNQGGRASCQDDWKTFEIMRKSQFSHWPEELLSSYFYDLAKASLSGRNLMTEKYGRMMESTAPAEYEKLKNYFPWRSEERIERQEKIIAIQVSWNEAVSAQYPNFRKQGRPIHTSEDTPWDTSFETYLRGEMSTWSDQTFALYEQWIQTLLEEGKNLEKITAEKMVQAYGYESLAHAEEMLGKR